MRRWVAGICVALAGASVARADVFSYQQENGTAAFTDRADRVPEKYRSSVKQRPDIKLGEYARTTVSESSKLTRPASPSVRLDEETVDVRAESRETQPRTLLVEAGPGISVPVELHGDEPLHVERVFRWIDGRYRPIIVVRQGERELSVIDTEAGR